MRWLFRLQAVDFCKQWIFAEQKVWIRWVDGRTEAKCRIENATWCTFARFDVTIALILFCLIGMIEDITRSLVTPCWHSIENVHLGIVGQRKFATKSFDKNLQLLLFVHQMWWKLWAIGAIDAIAFIGGPEVHQWSTIEVVNDSQFSQIIHTRIDRKRFNTCTISLENLQKKNENHLEDKSYRCVLHLPSQAYRICQTAAVHWMRTTFSISPPIRPNSPTRMSQPKPSVVGRNVFD